MRTSALVVALLLILTVAIVAAVRVWNALGPVDIGFHGALAMTLGIVLSLALGIGLMALVFVSSRRGIDEDQSGGGESP